MGLERTIILLLLFAFLAFLFPTMNAGIEAISAGNSLKPLLMTVPYLIVGVSFFAFVYLGIMERD